MTANALLAAAISNDYDKLSSRDCWLCLAQIYAGGNTAQQQLDAAIANGMDGLSNGDIIRCIDVLLAP